MLHIIIDFGTLHIGGLALPLRIYGYGLMLVLGFLLAMALATRRARRAGENPDEIGRTCMLALIGGVAGARIAFIIEKWDTFRDASPLELINVSSGGLIYYGGLVLAMLLVIGYLYLKRLPARRMLDILAPSVMLGLAFGRAGCLLNGCCYGGQCNADWPLAMRFPMYSKPLLDFGDKAGPFSAATEAPSPIYGEQYAKGELTPDERLTMQVGHVTVPPSLHPPKYLHGKLGREQLSVMMGTADEARVKLNRLVGAGGTMSYDEWRKALNAPDSVLRGSEFWDEAILYDADRDGRLSFNELWNYLQARRQWVLARFDADHDGRLNGQETADADSYLRADLFSLAEAQKSKAVKPAQALGIADALLLTVILSLFHRLRRREGQVFAFMLVLYPMVRFVEEAIRADNQHDLLRGILTHNQYTSLAMFAAGAIMFLVLRWLPPSAGSSLAQRVAGAKSQQAVHGSSMRRGGKSC